MKTKNKQQEFEDWILDVIHPNGTEERFLLEAPECVLGYAEECDLHIYEGSVSNRHAKFLRCKDGFWWLEDLGSTNGTWVENMQIMAPLALSAGMEIVFGDVEAKVLTKKKTESASFSI